MDGLVATGSARTTVRSPAQRRKALHRANEIRIARAQLKRRLATGSVQITDILAAPPACTQTQKVDELLLALPKYGPVRGSRLALALSDQSGKTRGGPQRPSAARS